MLFDKAGIAITDRCNARCAMCCFECKPENDTVFDKATLFDIISQLSDEGIKEVGLSGGEPMLYPELVYSALEHANSLGVSCSITSNGFWARDYDNAVKTLKRLTELNMSYLSISIDEYHLQYVDLQCLRNIINANRHIGLKLRIALGDSLERVSATDIIKELGTDIYAQSIIIYPFMPVGNALAIPAEKFVTIPYAPDWKCCYAGYFSILFDGSTHPCCSQAIHKSQLSAGNIYETPLKTLLHAYEDEGIFSTLLRQGLDYFVIIAKEDMGMELPDAYTSPCHLCNVLFSNDEFVGNVRPYVEAEYMDHVKKTLFGI